MRGLLNKRYLDFLINGLITIIQISASQFLIYPLIENTIKADKFGAFLTSVGFILSFYAPINIALSNFILRNNDKYSRAIYQLYFFGLICFSLISLLFPYPKENPEIILWGVLLGFRTVASAYIRHERNFKFLLLANVIALFSCFLVINYLKEYIHNPLILLVIYETVLAIFYFTRLPIKNSFKTRTIIRAEVIDIGRLFFLNLSANTSNYIDRFALQYFGNGQQVSIFFIITLFPKLLVTLGATINGVLLSYLSSENELHKSSYLKGLLAPTSLSVLFCLVIYSSISQLTEIIYPDFKWLEEYNLVLGISLLAFFINAQEKMIKGALIRFSEGKNLIRIELISSSIHMSLIIAGLSIKFSLTSLSIIMLFSFTFRLALTTFEFFKIQK